MSFFRPGNEDALRETLGTAYSFECGCAELCVRRAQVLNILHMERVCVLSALHVELRASWLTVGHKPGVYLIEAARGQISMCSIGTASPSLINRKRFIHLYTSGLVGLNA